MQIRPLQWAVLDDWRDRPLVCQIEEVTPKLVRWLAPHGNTRKRQMARDSVLAVFDDRDPADKLRDAIMGAQGERDRRIQAARNAYEEQRNKLILKATGNA